ncbi:MAG: TolC family protein [bacterium]
MKDFNVISLLIILLITMVGVLFSIELTVDYCVDMAISTDETLMAYYSDLESTHGQLISARGGFFPKLSLTSSYTRLEEVPMVTMPGDIIGQPGVELRIPMGTNEDYSFSTQLIQPLYAGGRIWSGYKMSKASERAMEYNVKEYKNTLVFNVRKQYLSLLLTDSLVKVTGESVKLAEEHYKVAEERYNVGFASKFEKLRAEVSLTNLKSSLINLENTRKVQEEALRQTLNLDPSEPIVLKDEMVFMPFDMTIDECKEKAVSDRPALLALNETEELMRRKVSFARAGYFPMISVIGSYDLSSTDFNDRDNWQDNWAVTLSLSWTPFDGLMTHGESITARADYKSIKFKKSAMKEVITIEVEGLYRKLESAKENLSAQEENINLASEGVKIAEAQYEVGLSTNLDVLDAQLALHQAKLGYYQALYDYLTSLYDINRAMGEM